jgi:hypothetical protein
VAEHQPPAMKIGVAWYDEAEWQMLRDLAADPEALEESYAEWRAAFGEGVLKLAAAGLVTERVDVAVAELKAWCDEHKRPLDGAARAEYASELVRRRYATRGDAPTGPRFWR